jgi:membrane protein
VTTVHGPDRFQRRHGWLGFPLAVVYKYFDDFGTYLAAIITYYAFVSLFPLLLIASTVLSVVLRGDAHLQQRLISSALTQFPLVGQELDKPEYLSGGAAGLIIGIAGSVYGVLGVAQAFQYASNTMWGIPRNSRPNPFKARGRSLVLLATASDGGVGALGTLEKYLAIAASVLINVAVSIFAFRFAPARRLSFRDVLPGAVASAIVWQLLQLFGVLYVRHVVRHASATNAVFAIVLGLVAYLFIAAISILLCIEINVVRVNHMHPRALLTPFTDDVSLTQGDKRAYTRQAKAQRSKGFQRIDVDFVPPEEPEEPAPEAEVDEAGEDAAGSQSGR